MNQFSIKKAQLSMALCLALLLPNWLSAAAPNWTVNPNNFQYSMSMIIRVKYNGVPNNAAGNLLGVFVGTELRGRAAPVFAGGNAYYFVSVYANVFNGETLRFQVYVAADDVVYPTPETAPFVHNSSIGSVASPFFVNVNPGAAYVSSNSPVCAEQNLTLSALPSGTGYTYVWSGPNGFISIAQSPAPFAATPAVAGTYAVTVTNGSGQTSTGSTTVTVKPLPSVAAASNTPVCVGANLSLTATPSGGSGSYAAFNWTGPNSYLASGQNPSAFAAVAASAGIYQVKVTDNNGCTATATTTVSVKPKPTIAATNNGPVCQNASLALNATPSGGSGVFTNFAWAGPGNFTANVQNPPSFPATATSGGLYTVTVTDNAGCSGTGTTNVLLRPTPTLGVASNAPLCVGNFLSLSSSASGGSGGYSTFNWTGPNGYISAVQNPPVFAATTSSDGIYQAKVTDNNGCTATATVTVSVKPPPTIAAMSNAPVCQTANLTLQSTPSGGSGIFSNFLWAGPAGFVSAIQNPPAFSVTAANSGTYTVTVTDNAGCTASGQTVVSVSANTAPTVSATSNSPVCSGANVSLLSTHSVTASPYTFAWAGPNGFASVLQNPTAFPAAASAIGAYTVTVTDGNGCKNSSSTVVSTVGGVAPIATSNSPVCVGGTINLSVIPPGPGSTYAWVGPNNFSSNQQNPPGIPASAGTAGAYTVTVTFGGCAVPVTTTVVVGDPVPPVVTCPPNATLAGNAACQAILPNYLPSTTATDNCTANPTKAQSPAAGTTILAGNQTVTLTSTDAAGNIGTCTFIVAVTDPAPPTITCPPNATVAANASCQAILGNYTANATASDNCTANPAKTQSPAAGITLSLGSQTVTITATDNGGNTGTCSLTFTVADLTAPTIVCPTNVTVAANASCQAILGNYTANATASDNCTANPTIAQTPAVGTTLNIGNQMITLTGTDAVGNFGICTFLVTVTDQTAPTIICPANTAVAPNASCQAVLGNYTASGTASDNCTASPAKTQSPAVGTALNTVNQTVILTATDAAGNTGTCNFTVSIADQTAPTIICPANTTVAANATCQAILANYAPNGTASDNCTASPTKTQSPAAGATISLGNQTVTLTATDEAGNTGTCSFTVAVADQAAPTIVCPANATVAANANCQAVLANYTPNGTASDNCTANPTKTQSPAVGTTLNIGNQTVRLTATDVAGNTGTCNFMVAVADQTAPTIVCPVNATVAANANCQAVLVNYAPNGTASDNCGTPTKTQSPVSGTTLNIGNQVVTLTATDATGNTGTCSFTVTVADQTAPTVVCQNLTVNLSAAGSATITTAQVFASGADNCGVVNQISVTPSTFGCSNIGANTVTLLVNDGRGNTATCTATVTVNDVTPPVVACKTTPVNVLLTTSGTVAVAVSSIHNSSSDGCGGVLTFSVNPSTMTCANVGLNNVVTLTASDPSGNTAACTATVTVQDKIKPTAKCKANTVFVDAAGTATITAAQVNNGSTDACGIASLSIPPTTFNCGQIGGATIPVTLTVTDLNANTANCTSNVTVKDNIPPVAVCTDVTVALGSNGQVNVVTAPLAWTSTDNCFVSTFTPTNVLYSMANLGVNSLTINVKDQSGNSTPCVSQVTITPFVLANPGSVAERESSQQPTLLVYPNPNAGEVLKLNFTGFSEAAGVVEIRNFMGQLLALKQFEPLPEGEVGLDISGFSTGAYVVLVKIPGERPLVRRFMIE